LNCRDFQDRRIADALVGATRHDEMTRNFRAGM
jgi:hypothetical protein